ncbi:MAG: SDR family oxidoreductase [Acidobacteria bacterium]|nr:SDR family oxidoreductase [Acidobacteriota bacterium]
MSQRTVLITGASSGIGAAFAEIFAAEGFNLVLVARREDRLHAIADRIRRQHHRSVEVVGADLSRVEAPAEICQELERRGLVIDGLVNNAGFGVPGSFVSSPWVRQQELLQVTIMAAAELTHRLLPGMIERRYGRVINMASLAALVPAPAGHTLYAACKALIVKFSEALANEVRPLGVHVTSSCPGFTLTEFHDVTGTRAMVQKMPSWLWIQADTVALESFEAVMAGVPLCVPGRINRVILALSRIVPQRLLVAIGRVTARGYRKVD